MNTTAKLTLFVLFAIIGNLLNAQGVSKYSNEFLSIGVGARSLGMGTATLSSTNDISATYWNPASLVSLDKQFEIGAMHSEYFAGISKYDYVGLGYKINDASAIALSMVRFGVDDIPNTLDLIDADGNINYDNISSFSIADYAFMVSYSHTLPVKGLSLGGNAKIIYRNVGEFAHAVGFGLDLAAKYEYRNWHFGLVLRDGIGTFNAWNYNRELLEDVFVQTNNEIPVNGVEVTVPKLMLGFGYKFVIKEKFTIYPELDLAATFDGKRSTLIRSKVLSIDPCFGLELGYNDLVFLRCGFNNFQLIPDYNEKQTFSWQPNIGVGVKFYGVRIDYAFTDIGNQSIALYSHVFSLSYCFNAKKKDSSKTNL
ncbi:MAG: PorV/PorQ family protein [Bacteroidales bacterium]|nr:PorV/PorQ family protein [Bacteroidales bacterium]